MNRLPNAFGILALQATLLFSQLPAQAAHDLTQMAAPIHDYTATVTATQVNLGELQKISKDYAYAYRLKTSRIYYLYPGHIKVDSSIGPVAALYIIVGNDKYTKYGFYHKRRDITDAPGLKESLLDFGMITKEALDDYTWKFLRTETAGGKKLEVYEMLYKNYKEDSSRFLVWVDPAHKVLTRRLIYHQLPNRSLKLDLRFENLTLVNGAWVPTTIKVFNSEGKLGALSKQSDIRVNKGVSMNVFKD